MNLSTPIPRIGVYICHCGMNIAPRVDVEAVTEFARGLDHVAIARDYKFMCSNPGQEFITHDIREQKLNRVVVASCSPRMHEPTFRKACEKAGINPYYFQMANIREQVSWVTFDGQLATAKAKDQVAAAVARVSFHTPLYSREVPVTKAVLVIGGGIAGMQAALTAAEAGYSVHVVEREPSIGGHMAKFDKTFPSLDCAACIMTPKMVDVGQHEKIHLHTYSEVSSVEGFVGNFRIGIRKKARHVDAAKCTGCGLCAEVCPVAVSNRFDEGLSRRKAIYRSFPQAVPITFCIDKKDRAPCVGACPAGINVQGYVQLIGNGKYREALSLIMEKLPLPGVLGRVCPHPCEAVCRRAEIDQPIAICDLKRFVADQVDLDSLPLPVIEERAERVAVIGSGPAGLTVAHDLRLKGYQVTLFEANSRLGGMLRLGIPDYRDFQRYRDRAEKEFGVRFVRCRLHSIEPAEHPGDLAVRYVTSDGETAGEIFDMVVLATGQKPGETFPALAGLEGVVTVGATPRLRDISETVLEASAAVGALMRQLRGRGIVPRRSDPVDAAARSEKVFEQAPRVQVVFCDIPGGAGAGLDFERVVEETGRLAGGVIASRFPSGPGPALWDEIKAAFTRGSANRFVIAVSGPMSYWAPVRRLCAEIGLPPSLVDVVDLHHFSSGDGDRAAALSAVEMAVNRLRMRGPRRDPARMVAKTALVVGGGPAGLAAARALAEHGIPVALVEKESALGGNLSRIHDLELRKKIEALKTAVEQNAAVTVYTEAELIWHHGLPGNFIGRIRRAPGEEKILDHGAVILATGGRPMETDAYGLGRHERIVTQFELERRLQSPEFLSQPIRQVAMIQCAGSREEPRNYCSRICCLKALSNAIRIKETQPAAEVYVFYRDIMTYGESERIYTEARRKGVFFIPFDLNQKPQVRVNNGELIIAARDPVMGEDVELRPDLLALAVGVVPAQTETLARMLGIALTADGFWQEADSKWRPVDSGREGIFVAGLGRAPARAEEAMREGEAAALRALHLLAKDVLAPQRLAARVRQAICSRCELCIQTCPYAARYKDPETGAILVDHAACQGCGGCAAVCPNSATVMGDFEDNGILDMIEAAL